MKSNKIISFCTITGVTNHSTTSKCRKFLLVTPNPAKPIRYQNLILTWFMVLQDINHLQILSLPSFFCFFFLVIWATLWGSLCLLNWRLLWCQLRSTRQTLMTIQDPLFHLPATASWWCAGLPHQEVKC